MHVNTPIAKQLAIVVVFFVASALVSFLWISLTNRERPTVPEGETVKKEVYLDYAGASQYDQSQIDSFTKLMTDTFLCNTRLSKLRWHDSHMLRFTQCMWVTER